MNSGYRSVFRPDLFAGRTYVVTGGGSGIGRCTAHELAALGANVVIMGRKLDKLEAVAAEIREDGGKVDVLAQDIREEDGVKQAITGLLAKHERIDGLVNNAGGQFTAPLETISQKGFETVVRTNLVGGFLLARELFNQHFNKPAPGSPAKEVRGGVIVNIVADMWKGMPGMGHSGAARAGMINFTQTAAVEWARAGVRVNAIAPGWIASSGMDTYPDMVKAMIPRLVDAVPLRRLGSEAEVSAAICFLLSPAAAFITGTTLCVDGAAPLMPHHWPMPPHDRSRAYQGFHRSNVGESLAKLTKPES